MAQLNADVTSTCMSCTDPDVTNMVTCSGCLGSYHRTCCDITEAVDMFSWICESCALFGLLPNLNSLERVQTSNVGQTYAAPQQPLEQPASPCTNNTTVSQTDSRSGISRDKQLQLQYLEEEMLLRKEFLRRKYELLYSSDVEVDENEEGIQIVRPVVGNNNCYQETNPPCVQNIQRTANTRGMQNVDEFANTTQNHNNEHHSVNNIHLQGELTAVYNNNHNRHTLNPPRLHARRTPSINIMQNRGEYANLAQTPTITNIHIPQGQSTHIHHPNIMHTDDHELNIRSTINQNNNTIGCQNHDVNRTNNCCNMTTTQLVARQSISKDLPMFNGDSREWPIFFSSFEQSSRVAGYSNEENLIRLQKCLHGKARDAVRNCLMLPDMVPDIMRTLKMYFGRPECVLRSVIDEVRKISLQKGKLESLIEFAFAVKNICATIRASQLDNYLNNPTLLQELVDKLSPDTVLLWAMHSKDIGRPNLMDFSNWLYTVAEATCRVTIPVFDTNDKRQFRREGRLNTHSDSDPHKSQQQCVVCNEPHKIIQCTKFKGLTTAEKWDIVKAKNLCRTCLGKHRRRCWFQKLCGVNGCTVQHNALLHNEEHPLENTVSSLNSHKNEGESFFRVVPVTLYSDIKSITVYALMDDGSTLTLLEQGIADSLGIKGISDPLCIRWTGDVSRYEDTSQRCNLKISSTQPNSKVFPIKDVYTVKNLNLSSETMNAEYIKNKFPYLKDIPLEGYKNATPSMIIGVNNPNLISSMRTLEGGWQQPVASKTRLGWTIFGGGSKSGARLNFHKCSCEELHGLVKQYFSDESVAITSPTLEPMSKDDQKAIAILEKTCKLDDGRYEVGLLWKEDSPKLPNSLSTAIKRVQCVQRKAKRDPKLAETLQQQISSLVEKGYAERLPLSVLKQQEGKVWYLPTFIVRNPQKPNKIRLVWDAAAKSDDCALNDFLLKGPDLLRPLMNVLFKFRMGAIAICGDIAEMFHRIKVCKEDSRAQRFLWWDNNNSMIVYQLNVLTFGASCSPCIAHFVRDKNAHNFGGDTRVIEAITKQHYVDDFIDSAQTVEDAINLASKVRDVHAKGGFHMRNWSSNSVEVLNALGETSLTENKTFENIENLTQFEKILGLYWDPKNDIFKMNLKFVRLRRPILNEDIVPTKREVLQVLMSVFDPLGFVVCFMSYLKSILQEIWRSGIDWDQTLDKELYCKWKNWLTLLPAITTVSIPRCYSMAMQNHIYKAELHTFVDASEDAYAAVSYFRIEVGSHVEVRLVAAKAKVAPLRPLSVPRLELQAATIGARLTKTVSCHDFNIERTVMWTDSKTVLSWIAGDPRKYKQFVMFRIAEILKFTNVKDWRWVPSALNVADFATKYRPATDNYQEWFDGPSWLLLPETDWPTSTNEPTIVSMDTSEIRHRYLNIHTRKSIMVSINFDYFSSWYRLCRAVGNWIVYVQRRQQKLKEQESVVNLSASHLIKAKNIIYKSIQISGFADDYAAVEMGKPVPKGGALDKLNVYIDGDGVVKVKNRTQYATPACGPQRDLIILPGNHPGTKLIVNNYHRAYHHSNHETVLNEIRQTYFIIRLRVIYKVIRRNCQHCKIEGARPTTPQMSPLPPARLGAFQRPFTFVGVDYFGPIAVTFGRKSLKRWGVVFTCLTIRAVHLEVSHTLSTDSFLMALRNFVARRGSPAEIYSDNGTNFRGADRFLKEQIKNINFINVHTEMALEGITWKFNPPAAPHMGGAWERLVRSIKTILYKISPSQKFTDESLRSALMEVEMVINSRPLTYVSLETEDQEAITPNHFLLGSSSGAKPICNPENMDYRLCLRQSEVFANLFWRRFVKEMLPTLTRRSKWSQRVKPIDVGDIVVVVDENVERNVWLKGKVIEVVKAKDGQVRRAKVKTKNGVIERPAVKLAVLDVGNRME